MTPIERDAPHDEDDLLWTGAVLLIIQRVALKHVAGVPDCGNRAQSLAHAGSSVKNRRMRVRFAG